MIDAFFDGLARSIPDTGRRTLAAVDGVDGSGKTTFAAGLAAAVERAGRPVEVVHGDDFLHPRAVRHRLGRDSPEGFFRDSVDLGSLARLVLDPLGRGGDGRFQRRSHDLAADAAVDEAPEAAPCGALVLVEGMFLHRDELAGRWDWSVFLDVPFEETAHRMARRDGSHPDPLHPSMRRYVEGQRLYFAACTPWERATVVVDNADPSAPRIRRPPQPG